MVYRDTDIRVLRALLLRPELPIMASDLALITRRGRRSVQRSLRKLQSLGLAGCHGRLWLWRPESLGTPGRERPLPSPPEQRVRPRDLDLCLIRLALHSPHRLWSAAEFTLLTLSPTATVRRRCQQLAELQLLWRDPSTGTRRARYKLDADLSIRLGSSRARTKQIYKDFNYG